ncbi:hypothetical protein B0H10DRAFT_1943812 [Mycena sp. CBHHK59/15]|nr:hypothetical protein B0H10DRAFT_1943812 [Mycena sp. CBHHK59/15]
MDGFINLDNLLNAVNTCQAALESSNQVPGNTSISPSHRRAHEDDDNESEGDRAGAAAGAEEPHNPGEMIMFSLEAGRAYKKQKTLSPASDLICEEFLKVWDTSLNTSNPVKHQFMLLTTVLENSDMLRTLTGNVEAKGWVLPPALKAALHICNVTELPPASETGRLTTVSEVIGTALTNARHLLKSNLTDSTTKKTDLVNLSKNCVSKAKALATAAMYRRMAWLRLQLVAFQVLKSSQTQGSDKLDFWTHVDNKLDELHQKFPENAVRDMALTLIYEDDIAQYGALDPSIRVAPAATIDGWLGTIDKQTSLVAN